MNKKELLQIPCSSIKPISLKEILETKPEDIKEVPGKYCGYIMPDGYIALKHFTTMRRFKEIQEADGLIINIFKAKGYGDAMRQVRDILKKALYKLDKEVTDATHLESPAQE